MRSSLALLTFSLFSTTPYITTIASTGQEMIDISLLNVNAFSIIKKVRCNEKRFEINTVSQEFTNSKNYKIVSITSLEEQIN